MNGHGWQVAIFGTFDVENYGDLLFPIIAQEELTRRLGSVNLQPFSYSTKNSSEWPYAVTSLVELPDAAGNLDGVLIGGGFLIRFDKFVAQGYGPTTPNIHHPTGYWLTPALIAAQHAIPLIWNAPGMHCNDIPGWARPLLKVALEQSRYVRVRDTLSCDTLRAVTGDVEINVLPDTAFGLPRLIDEEQLSTEFTQLREQMGLKDKYIVIHAVRAVDVIEPYLKMFESHPEIFGDYQILVIPIGPILGDDSSPFIKRLPRAISLSFWPQPLLLAEVLSQAQAVIGHSYHLTITALAFGVPVFSLADLTAGKYTSLAGFDSLHVLPDAGGADAQWFIARVGKTQPSKAAREAADALVGHWDKVAEIIRHGKTSSRPALNAFWQNLPNLLETAAERCEVLQRQVRQLGQDIALGATRILELQNAAAEDNTRHREDLLASQRIQQEQLLLLSQQLALSDARVDQLQNSSSFRITAPLRSIARGLRNLTANKN